MLILGLDPSTLNTGWGIISVSKTNAMSYVDGGVIKPKKNLTVDQRVLFIYKAVKDILKENNTTSDVASEAGFVGYRNFKTAMSLQAARTACMIAVMESGYTWNEIKPSEIKEAITGHGGASKSEVAEMVYITLGSPSNLIGVPDDVTDALGAAIAHVGNLALKMKYREAVE
jgi:crossover junction endodeoxyribonuclease RuvC